MVDELHYMADLISCYRVLGVRQGANLVELKQAYRDQVKVWHPDAFHEDSRLQRRAQEQLKRINIAYRQILAAYDAAPNQQTISFEDEKGASVHSNARPAGSARFLKACFIAAGVIILFFASWFTMKDGFAELFYNVGIAFSDSARHGESIYALRFACFIKPDNARFSIALGKAYQEKRQYKDAEKAYARAVDVEPGNQEAFRWLAILYMDQNRYDDALKTFASALELDPTNPALLYDIGILYGRLGLAGLRRDIQKKAVQLDLSFEKEVPNDNSAVAPSGDDPQGAIEKGALPGELAEQISRIQRVTDALQ